MADGGGTDKRYVGGGLRLASGAAAPRLDHGYFEEEVRPRLGTILLRKGWISHDRLDAGLEAPGSAACASGRRCLRAVGCSSPSWRLRSPNSSACATSTSCATRSTRGGAAPAALEVARRMFVVPVRFMESGVLEVAVGDPSDADADALEQVLGRRVELVVGERSVIQDAWRYLR
jgi:hypothetical protein